MATGHIQLILFKINALHRSTSQVFGVRLLVHILSALLRLLELERGCVSMYRLRQAQIRVFDRADARRDCSRKIASGHPTETFEPLIPHLNPHISSKAPLGRVGNHR